MCIWQALLENVVRVNTQIKSIVGISRLGAISEVHKLFRSHSEFVLEFNEAAKNLPPRRYLTSVCKISVSYRKPFQCREERIVCCVKFVLLQSSLFLLRCLKLYLFWVSASWQRVLPHFIVECLNFTFNQLSGESCNKTSV